MLTRVEDLRLTGVRLGDVEGSFRLGGRAHGVKLTDGDRLGAASTQNTLRCRIGQQPMPPSHRGPGSMHDNACNLRNEIHTQNNFSGT
jgi:hypothetical protein